MLSEKVALGTALLDVPRRYLGFEGTEISLTTAEFELLRAFAEKLGQTCTRDDLFLRLVGRPWDGKSRAIDVGVGRLRRKLREETRGYLWIHSVRNVGYQLVIRA